MDPFSQIQHLLKIQNELETGTYKRMPNNERLKQFNTELKQIRKERKTYPTAIKHTCTTDCKVGSTNKSFNSNMKPITIKEMTLGTTYKNRYIKFEIVTELMIMASIMFLGKDENGDLVLIAIYNFEKHYGTKDYKTLNYIFQKGKYVLVLEPFYKIFGSGEDGIRIEDPNEIIIFDDKEWINKFLETQNQEESFKLFHDDEEKDFNDLYKEANKSFCIQNYTTALAHFIKLKSLKPEEIKFDLKIAECYFNLPYYTKAIKKCDEILNGNILDNNEIGNKYYLTFLLLKIKSLIKLKKIDEANEIINENKEIIKNNHKECFDIEEEINKKIKNMKGEYDFIEIYEESKKSKNIDIGEYLNDKLEIKFIKNKGISIYTKDKINIGELILVSKAIAFSEPKKEKNIKDELIKFDNPDKNDYRNAGKPLVMRRNDEIEEMLSYKLSNYPEDFTDFLCLFDGKNKNINLEERKENKKIDLRKIQNVIEYNSKTLYFSEEPISYGLWYYPSLFNHSCIPNCYHFGFGDILIIIAINDIEPNSELFLNYFYNDMLYDERQKNLKEYYEFECNCELCKYEKNKFKECNEKKKLDDHLKILNSNINSAFERFYLKKETENEEQILNKKEIEQMIKFIEKNKKMFSCYEKSYLYLKSAQCMRMYDPYIAYEYLEKSLKYSENRNYYFEKLTLFAMSKVAKQLRSEVRIQFSANKFKEFWEKYFPNQKNLLKCF